MVRSPVRNRISKIGVELEGGWDKDPGILIAADGSVQFPSPISDDGLPALGSYGQKMAALMVGEIRSNPMDLSEISAFILKVYPQLVNETCGLHVHMSLIRKYFYQRLMDPSYQDTVFETVSAWAKEKKFSKSHPIWKRLSGSHTTCMRQFLADAQVRVAKKKYDHNVPYSRYTAINYPWLQHKTVECRLLPMFEDAPDAVEGVLLVVDTTNKFLAKQRDKEPKHLIRLPITNDLFVRHYDINI